MKIRTAKVFSAAGAGIALLYLYFLFIIAFFSNPHLYPQTSVEIAIILIQIAKVVIIMTIRRLRYARSATIWVILALDTLMIPVLTTAFFVTGDRTYLDLFRNIFSVWPVALLLVATPYLIFRFSAQMFTAVKLTRVLPSAVLEFSFFTFVANLFLAEAQSIPNLESVLVFFATGVRGAVVRSQGILFQTNLLTAPSIIFYLALVIYATLPANGVHDIDIPTALLIPLLGTVALLVWILSAIALLPSALISLTVPSVVIAALIWWLGRGK